MTKRFNGKGKAILVPYPAQGHVTPMLMLATRLLNQGSEPVMVIPEFIHRRISSQISLFDGIFCIPIPDGMEEGKLSDFFAIETTMELDMPSHLQRLVQQFQEEDGGVACLIVDLLASYALDVANRCGVKVAGFWPAMLATYRLIAAIPDMLRAGFISETGCPLQESSDMFFSSCGIQATISVEELPWLIGTSSERKGRFKFWIRTLERSVSLRRLLVNTFPEECQGAGNESQSGPLILPIQPINTQERIRKVSFWEEDSSCLDWLHKQTARSVVYVSFGSWVSPIGKTNLKSLALALEATGRPFLWVLGNAWHEGLPSGYMERVSEKEQGKIVSWAPQMDVLQHPAVGCYLTHCGWNSTMEAIQCKKPLLCYPVAGDQFLNCAYIVKVWRIGVRIKGLEHKDLEEVLNMVMEDREMSIKVMEIKERLMSQEACQISGDNFTIFIGSLNELGST